MRYSEKNERKKCIKCHKNKPKFFYTPSWAVCGKCEKRLEILLEPLNKEREQLLKNFMEGAIT